MPLLKVKERIYQRLLLYGCIESEKLGQEGQQGHFHFYEVCQGDLCILEGLEMYPEMAR